MAAPQPPPAPSPTLMLTVLGRVAGRRVEGLLAPYGLAVRGFGTLGHVHRQPGISYTELARRAQVSVQSMHATVAQLMAAGLVRTEGDTARGRSAVLLVTERGEGVLREVYADAARLDEELFGDDVADLSARLGRAAAALAAAATVTS